jgi:preprotein translocase subunit SecG
MFIDISFWTAFVLFILVCLFLILLVLIQKGRGGGLASAFGGAGGNTAFGSKTGDVLTWTTSVVFGVFLVLAVSLNLLANARHSRDNPGAVTSSVPARPTSPAGAGGTAGTNVPPAVPDTTTPVPGNSSSTTQPTK